MVNTKVQLQQGATKVQRGASTATAGVAAMSQAAAQSMQSAAQQMQSAAQNAQHAAANVNAGVRSSTLSARGWAAPRLQHAADFTESKAAPAISDAVVKNIAPKVSSALRTTAKQVNPQKSRSSWRMAFAWSALAATVLAGAGAVGVLAWRRYREAMAADTEPDAVADPGNVAPSDAAGTNDPASEVPDSASSAW